MADEKTILRELSVIIGVGLAREKRGNKPSNPNEFIRLAEEFCKNIQEHNIELEKIKSIKNFENSQISIIKNGLTLGTYIYEKSCIFRLFKFINPDKDKILEILQIYKNEYYFGKSLNKVPKLFKVPSKDKCDIASLTVNYKVPKSQLNVLFTFEVIISLNGSDKNSKIEMHVECRYSHGQFNGIPEAKLYCKDSLDKLYQELT